MRAYGNQRNTGPTWITAAVIFILLIALVQLFGSSNQTRPLEQEFAARPPAELPQIPLPPVPTNLADLARTSTARLLGGLASRPVVGEEKNETLRVQIDSLQREGDNVRLKGSIANISTAPQDVSLDYFKFSDGATTYASSGSPPTTLQPNQSAPLDLTLPIANPTQLSLTVEQPGQSKIEMLLASNTPAATPAP